MDKLALFQVLLLPLCLCFDSEVTLVKTIGSETDVIPICNNANLSTIELIVCKIRTEMNSRNECRLLYKYGEDFVQECGSRFTLITKNQTVLLHLISLTPKDSGYYSCECSELTGTSILHLNITVEVKFESKDVRRSTPLLLLGVCIGGTMVFIITGVFLGFICRIICHGNSSGSPTSGLSVTPGSLDEVDPDDPYTSLQYPANDLYQTISHSASNVETARFENQEVDERDPIYEVI